MDELIDAKITILHNNIQNNIDENNDFNKELLLNELNITTTKRKIIKNKNQVKNDIVKNDIVKDDVKEKEKIKFNELQDIKFKYESFDSIILTKEQIFKLPTFLFFHKHIIEKYKICPFILINNNEEIDNILLNRYNWLLEQNDKGNIYYELYNKIINKIEYIQSIENKDKLEQYFNEFHLNFLNDEQNNLLNTIKEYLQEYISSNIKTKKLKDKFNIIINNVSLLVAETTIQLNEYLSLLYNVYIPINNNNHNKKETIEMKEFFSFDYNENLINYKNIINDIQTLDKNLLNTISNLKVELCDYLYKKIHNFNKNQIGKFFKKWSLLSNDEKLDRFYSYSEYICHKYLNESNISKTEIDNIINILKNLLNDNLIKIKYKYLKWDVNRGIITNINCLKFNDEKKAFFLSIKAEEEIINNIIQPKKISSIRTILNKESNKIVNNQLMNFLILNKKQNKLKQDKINELKDEFLEKIKNHFKIKRLTLHDKEEILSYFDKMFTIIYHNNCE